MDNLSETRLIEAIRQLQSLYTPELPNEFFGSLTFDETENDEFHELQKEFWKNYRRIKLQVETAQQHLLDVAIKSGFDVPSAWLSVRYNSVIESVRYHREGYKPDGQLIRTINRSGPDCVALKAVREDMRIAQMRLTAAIGSMPDDAPNGQSGRKKTTGNLASFANVRRKRKPPMTWADILVEYQLKNPEATNSNGEPLTLENVRGAWRREYNKKPK